MDRHQHIWTESALRELLAECSGDFTRTEIQEVAAFVDASEFGLALESLCGIIVEEHKTITEGTYSRLVSLATAMRMDEKVLTPQLRSRVVSV